MLRGKAIADENGGGIKQRKYEEIGLLIQSSLLLVSYTVKNFDQIQSLFSDESRDEQKERLWKNFGLLRIVSCRVVLCRVEPQS